MNHLQCCTIFTNFERWKYYRIEWILWIFFLFFFIIKKLHEKFQLSNMYFSYSSYPIRLYLSTNSTIIKIFLKRSKIYFYAFKVQTSKKGLKCALMLLVFKIKGDLSNWTVSFLPDYRMLDRIFIKFYRLEMTALF